MRVWYGRIKRRRGSNISRVAAMRRLATIIWHMVKHNEPYVAGWSACAPTGVADGVTLHDKS